MEIIGKLEAIFDTQKVSDKFMKRDFVIKTEESTPYPQLISVQVTQDKCQILDLYNIGDDVKIQINIKGRKWEGPQGTKYFNTIEAWRIENINGTTSAAPTPKVTKEQVDNIENTSTDGGSLDNLPF